jgi:hypothetical protein
MNVYVVPCTRPVIVVVEVLLPTTLMPAGLLVTVQLPVGGNPFNTTLPVGTVHVGWVIKPIPGALGVAGCACIGTFPDATEVHPWEFVTVNVYVVEAASPATIKLDPVPATDIPAGLLVTVQLPGEGSPLKLTLPVGKMQVGWVIAPITGAEGTARIVTEVVTGTVGQPPDAGIV